jgi:plasmid stabilization system protein ParE
MKYEIRLREEAEKDLDEAASWYEDRRNGLGMDFLDAVSSTFAEISANPNQFPTVHRGTHRALLAKFPYGVFFSVRGSNVDVLAVFHASRNPSVWRGRA